MANNDDHVEVAVERIDADAVCAECGTVNPEGALLCKSCGNNLRDQRMQRITGGDGAAVVGPEGPSPVWLKGLFALFGILVVIWAALNADNIASMAVGANAGRSLEDSGDPEAFWNGPADGAYEAMVDAIRTNPTPKAAADAALTAPAVSDTYEGRYVLVVNNPLFGPAVMGEVEVRIDSGNLLFAGLVANEEYEIRGMAEFEGGERISVRNTAAVRKGNRFYLGQGFAAENAPGVLACYAMSDIDADGSFSVLAYKVSGSAAPPSGQ